MSRCHAFRLFPAGKPCALLAGLVGSTNRTKGDHMILVKMGARANLPVPDHPELDRGTLRRRMALAGLDVQEFIELLRK